MLIDFESNANVEKKIEITPNQIDNSLLAYARDSIRCRTECPAFQ